MRAMAWFSAWALLLAVVPPVLLAQSANDAAATLVSQTGPVSVLRDSIPWALHPGDTVKPRQVIVTGPDGFAVFKVSDGSTFEVFPNSQVIFRDNPGNWTDLLEMLLGRVKVHIQKKWGGQGNPNKVRTPTAIISVRGTIFDVSIEDGDTTFVIVEEGLVGVEHKYFPAPAPKLLNAGEWIRVYKNEPLAQKSFDRGGVIRAALRALSDALYTVMTPTPRTGGGTPAPGGGSGGGIPGDRGGQTDPSPAPPSGGGTTAPTPPTPSGPGAPPPPPGR